MIPAAPSRFRIWIVLSAHPVSFQRYRFCPSPTRRILAIGTLRRDAGLSPAAFARQSEARNPVNECNVVASAISFRTASTIRSNSTSLITRSKAGPTFCRPVGKRARAEHRSSREFVVRRLGHGRFGGKIGPKSGRSSPRASRKPAVPQTDGRHPLAQLGGCVLDSATNQESLHAGRQ